MDEVSICNMALAHFGHDGTISALDQGGTIANKCNAFYSVARDTYLRKIAPPFSIKRQALALTAYALDDWAYVYTYPNDCLKVLKILDGGTRMPIPELTWPWKVMNISGVKVITVDYDEAEIEYVYRCENLNLWDAPHQVALSYLLASMLAVPITGKIEIRNSMLEMYSAFTSEAQAISLNECNRDQPTPCDLVRARQ